MDIDLAKLGRFIVERFDQSQLQSLCQELGVDYGQLLGATRSAKAFDLVTLMRDQGQLSALLAAVAQAQPDVFDPKDFEVQHQRKGNRRWGMGWVALLGAGLIVALLVLFFLINRDSASTPSANPTAKPSPSSTAIPPTPSVIPAMPTVVTSTPAPISATPTAVKPTSTPIPPTPTASLSPSPSSSATRTAPVATTGTFTPTPSPTPPLSSSTPALSYDAETHTLRLAPGDAALGRARLCTQLNAYQNAETVYLAESVADALGLALPAQAYVTHSFDEKLADGPVTYTFQVRSHPLAGIKVTGQDADFIGCDLIVSEDLRQLLGFPANLGEFNDPPRFEHGWVTIEFLPATPNP